MSVRTHHLPAARPEEGTPPSARWLALAVLCVSLLMVTLDNTVLNVALPTLVRDLGATTTNLQWIVDSYVIVFAGLLLVGGSLARAAFASGMDLGLRTGAVAALGGCLIALAALPSRPSRTERRH